MRVISLCRDEDISVWSKTRVLFRVLDIDRAKEIVRHSGAGSAPNLVVTNAPRSIEFKLVFSFGHGSPEPTAIPIPF